jgi:Xaa-Pro aminopeptidase
MEKIEKLKKLILNLKIDGYLVPKNDEFFSEYVPKNKDNLNYITNFSGSSGFALVLKDKNYLFIDGRYTLQAKNQSGKNFEIITIPKRLPKDVLKNKNLLIGFDPRLHTELMLKQFFQNTKCKLININYNLIDKIKKLPFLEKPKKIFVIKDKDAGEGKKSKINKLIKINKKNKIDIQFVTAPENVAWLLNIRGGDSDFAPLPNSYIILDRKKTLYLFCNLNKINTKTRKLLKNISVIDIKFVEKFLSNINNKKIQIDRLSCSILFKNILKKNNLIIDKQDPIYYLKCIKNNIEIKNTIKSHIFDGVALTKFIFWIKNNFKNRKITEIDAQTKLLSFRKKNKNFLSLSFPTISGTGSNGAIIHYKANKSTNKILSKKDLYLVDSGAQYKFGTTDVTRTLSLENFDPGIKNIYTRVLKGHIAVANFKINKKTTGSKIDKEARKYLKQINLDYPHGTGHGVGYFLNVHEGPQAISSKNKIRLKEGMILSNEPGYYENGKFGIRIENLIRVEKVGKFYKFENLTLAPIDKSLIEKKLLKKDEIYWLNSYHKKVYKNLKKYMNKHELNDLKSQCSNI